MGWEPLHPLAWELVQGGVAEALARPADLAAGDPDAYAGLVNGLILRAVDEVYGELAGFGRRALLQSSVGA